MNERVNSDQWVVKERKRSGGRMEESREMRSG